MTWKPSLGAWPSDPGTCFRVWAPDVSRVELVVEADSTGESDGRERRLALTREAEGTHHIECDDVRPGARYQYLLDGRGPFPDPASRAQPAGVHGPSEVVDPAFLWTDGGWRGIAIEDVVLYELHIGTFTRTGTFASAMERLPYLAELGVTAVELMPVADFAGTRNWGYDGVAWFAPAHVYGPPEDLRAFVNRAHEVGLAVVLDVVYNHLGPDGSYHTQFSPYYLSADHLSPWGPAINFDGPHASGTRAFVIENALHWLHEYHIDGLRLDATHAMVDTGSTHIMAELAARVRASSRPEALLIAEDSRNLTAIVSAPQAHGWGFDAVWADDLHHQLRRGTAGDADGYFADYTGSTPDIAATVRRGWFYCGKRSRYLDGPRGTNPEGVPLSRFVVCLQNHDQVGNRAHGDRLHHRVDDAVHRALATLLCCVPETPLLFMGQEWAAGAPFCYFTDHHESLGREVTTGRRREFARFRAFSDPAERARIPDPQSLATFESSRLDWSELDDEAHARIHRLYAALLALRRTTPALHVAETSGSPIATALGEESLVVWRRAPDGTWIAVVCHLRGTASVRVAGAWSGASRWSVLLTTEDHRFVDTPSMPAIVTDPLEITFTRPGAVILAGREGA